MYRVLSFYTCTHICTCVAQCTVSDAILCSVLHPNRHAVRLCKGLGAPLIISVINPAGQYLQTYGIYEVYEYTIYGTGTTWTFVYKELVICICAFGS